LRWKIREEQLERAEARWPFVKTRKGKGTWGSSLSLYI